MNLEAVYLGGLLEGIGYFSFPIPINTDNQGTATISKDAKHRERTKHIRVRFHKTRELMEEGITEVCWIPRTENPADIGMKALPQREFEKWRTEIGGL